MKLSSDNEIMTLYVVFLLLIIHTSGVRQLLKSINLIFLFKLKDVARVKDKSSFKQEVQESSNGQFLQVYPLLGGGFWL